MKVLILVFFAAFPAQFLFSQNMETTNKHALIVAIGDYPEYGGWGKISGNKDVAYISKALSNQNFPMENIQVLVDSQATKSNIENELRALYSRIQPGDIVVIHFSTHGEQIEDDNGDESDKLDEAIVTYKAIAPSKSENFSKDTAGYFRDDRFGDYVKLFRKKLGAKGDLVVFIDACHSGSGTRGQMKTRGGQKPLVSKNFIPAMGNDKDGVFKENTSQLSETGLASYIVFSAARAEELAFEVLNENKESMGSLTYAISKAFEQLDNGITYRMLFSRIQSAMNSKVQGQHPVMEGNGIDRGLFGGKYVKQKSYAEIDKFISADIMELNAGKFAGLSPGAKVLLFPSETSDPLIATPFDSAVVVSGEMYKSRIKTNKLYKGRPANTWVFVSEPIYNMPQIGMAIKEKGNTKSGMGFTPGEAASLKNQLSEFKQISFTEIPDLSLNRGPDKDSLIVLSTGHYFAGVPRDEAYISNLKKLLEHYTQYKFLRDLELSDSSLKLKVALVPIMAGLPDTSATQSKIKNGVCSFAEGDEFTLLVTNNSHGPVYFNIIELQPDGIINPIVPNREQNVYARDLQIEAKTSKLFSDFIIGIGPPFGTNIYKVFVSKKPIDLESLINPLDNSTYRGSFGVLEKLVTASQETSRGSNVSVKTSQANGSVHDLIFEIVPMN